MRSRIPVLVLGLLVAGLAAFVVFFEKDLPSTTELRERRGKWLSRFVRERLTSFTVERAGGRFTLGVRDLPADDPGLDRWRITAPFDDDADDEAVDMLLGAVEWAVPRRRLAGLDAATRTSLGLGRPRATLTLITKQERVVVRLFGEDPRGEGVYAEVDGEPDLYIVGKDVFEAVDYGADHFRARELFGRFSMHRASVVEWSEAAARVRAERRGNAWVLKDGAVETPANGVRIEGILTALDEARIERFVEAAPANARHARIELGFGRAEHATTPAFVEFDVGGPCDGYPDERMVRVGNRPTGCVPLRFVDVLSRATADDLRETDD